MTPPLWFRTNERLADSLGLNNSPGPTSNQSWELSKSTGIRAYCYIKTYSEHPKLTLFQAELTSSGAVDVKAPAPW